MPTLPAFSDLETSRLSLRRLVADDIPGLFAIYSDREVSRYLSRPAMTQMSEAEAQFARFDDSQRAGTGMSWGLRLRGEPELLGTCSIFRIDADNRSAELGYVLARPSWGRGLMHEALLAAVDHAFGPLGLNRLEADVDPRNRGSLRSVERLGFRQEGLLRERWIVAGEICDTALFGLLRREWLAARGAATASG
jgi:RimJ/RimL family protein N-acetyltransferase